MKENTADRSSRLFKEGHTKHHNYFSSLKREHYGLFSANEDFLPIGMALCQLQLMAVYTD